MTLVWVVNLVEFRRPLHPGSRLGERERLVFEVRRLESRAFVAGARRRLFVALHEGGTTTFVVLHGQQREWTHEPARVVEGRRGR